MKEHYPNFDWLRLLFALQVVAIHSGAWQHVYISPVAAFIAVSGFVVLSSLERSSVTQFFINRALRVLPLLFASFLALWWLFDYSEMSQTIKFWLLPFVYSPPAVNAVVWTLFYEEFFYVLLVLLGAVGAYRYRFLSLVFSALFMGLTIAKIYFGLPSPFFFFGGAFFIGNAVYLYRQELKCINKWVALVAAFIMVVVVQALPYTAVVQPERAALDFLSFFVILVFAISGPQLPRLYIDLSYSLYLIHCIVRAELLYYVPIGTVEIFWFMLLSSLPICFASWYLIEKPFLRIKKKIGIWRKRQQSTIVALNGGS